jgi:hypothetical protein
MKMLTSGSRGVANLVQGRVILMPVLGGFELVFHVPGQSAVRDDHCWVTLHAADIVVSAGHAKPTRIGTARPIAPLRLWTRPQPVPFTWEFRLAVTSMQLASIEDMRESNDLTFKLALEGEGGPVENGNPLDRVLDDYWIHVPRSEWIAALNDAEAANIALLEIPMPFVKPPEALREAMEMLQRAQHLFVDGRYSESVSRCRAAFEALGKLQGRDGNWSSTAFQPFRAGQTKDMSKIQREAAVEGAVMHLTHLGAHPTEVQIDRRDAKFVIALTASILAFNAS